MIVHGATGIACTSLAPGEDFSQAADFYTVLAAGGPADSALEAAVERWGTVVRARGGLACRDAEAWAARGNAWLQLGFPHVAAASGAACIALAPMLPAVGPARPLQLSHT